MRVKYSFEMPEYKDVQKEHCGHVVNLLLDREIQSAVEVMEERKVSLTELYVFIHEEERNPIGGKYRNE